MNLSRFKIVMKRRWFLGKREIVVVYGDGYFISAVDSTGYARFVIFTKEGTARVHQFLCNSHDVHYVLMKSLDDEKEKRVL